MRQEKRKKRGREKAKKKEFKTAVSLLNPKNFAFGAGALPELCKLIFCIWVRTP